MNKSFWQIQTEVAAWNTKNFGRQADWEQLLGVVEEVGELSHAVLKAHQGIRTSEDHEAAAKDAICDIMIYLMNFCNCRGYDLDTILNQAWEQVSKRDWTKNKVDGN